MITGESEDVLARTGITADMEKDRAPDAAVEADRPAGTSPYTVSGVDESRRKAVDRGQSRRRQRMRMSGKCI